MINFSVEDNSLPISEVLLQIECTFSRNTWKNILRSLAGDFVSIMRYPDADRPMAREIKLISMCAAIFGCSICVQCFFGICLTGFDDICLDDRVTLTKCSIYRNVLLVCSTRYDLETGRHYVFGWRSWREGPQKLVDTCAEYQV